MKTSLICLLLLAAVACAAPQAGEMPGEKRVGMAEKMREKMAEKREEIFEKMREMAKEKREESENAVADAKFYVETDSRSESCNGPCNLYYGVYRGCIVDSCNYEEDAMSYDDSTGCTCCFMFNAEKICT